MKTSIFALLLATFFLQGCSPQVGSDEWCDDLKDKPKADWSANEAKDFAQHCVFK